MSSPLNIVLGIAGTPAVLNALSGVSGTLLRLAGTAAVVQQALQGVGGALDLGGELNDLRSRTGQSVRDLVVLRRTFDNTGVGAGSTGQMIGLLQKALGGVNEEGGKTDSVFKRLGVSQEGLKNMGARDQLAALTQGFEKIVNPSERAALAMQLFGRNGAQMLQLLGDSSAISTAEREVGRLADRAQQNAARFDEVGDRLSLAKLRLQEFWVVAAERAIPALERMAELIQAFNPSVAGAAAGSVATVVGALFAANLVSKLDSAVLNWATKQGAPVGQAFAGRFLAPMTGALAKVLPIGLAAAIASEVLQGIVAGYAEWRAQQLAGANSGFDALSRVQGKITGVRSQEDVRNALREADALHRSITESLKVEEERTIKNERAISSYRQQLEQLEALTKRIDSSWAAAQIAKNKLADQDAAAAKREKEAAEFLASDEGKALKAETNAAIIARGASEVRLFIHRQNLAAAESILRVQVRGAFWEKASLEALAAREKALAGIAEEEEKIRQIRQSQMAANLAAIDNDFTLTEAEKFDRRRAVQGSRAGLGADPNSFIEQAITGLVRLRDAWGTTAQQIGGTIQNTIGSSVDLVTQGITGWIIRAGDWKQRLLQGAQAIGVNILQSIVGVGVRWIATQLMMATVGKALLASSVAAQIPLATASAAIWATPATLATIATGGAAAAQAPLSIGAASALTKAQALIPGFEAGDFTGGRRGQIAGFVHGEEFVFSAPAVDAIGVGNLRSMHEAALGGGAVPAAGTGGAMPNITVIQVQSEREATRVARNSRARGDIVRIMEEEFPGLRRFRSTG